MRPVAALFCLVPALLAAQGADLDEGRLDPTWFGPGAAFKASKALGFQWLKPGLELRNRTLRLEAWEAPAWLLGPRAPKDLALLQRVGDHLAPALDQNLKKGLKGALPVAAGGDVRILGRVVDAIGRDDDYMAMGSVSLSFDLKVVDGDTGELLAAFHDTLQGPDPEAVTLRFRRWCEELGKTLARAVTAPPTPADATKVQTPPPPPFDLEGALRRIEGLKRDGLLSEAEYLALKKKAADRAR